MNKKSIIIGLLTAAAAGAVAGILFAPRKGSKTRKKLIRKGREKAAGLKSELSDMVDDLTEKFSGVANEMTEKFKRSTTRETEGT